MATRAHNIKKYEPEYGACSFSYGEDFLISMFEDFDVGGDFDNDDLWEINKYDFERMVKSLKKMPAKEFNKKAKGWGASKDDGWTKKYVIDTLQRWLDEDETDDGWLRVSWY